MAPATILGLLGPNGAGKTTAVRILTTILRPDAGRATVLGIDVAKHPQAVRERIGLAGQYAAVDENLTGRENLRLIGASHPPVEGAVVAARRRAARAVRSRPMPPTGRSRTYSGGMRRRLDLAAALVHRPPVLFLDEPTTGLDPSSRNDLWVVIQELVGQGTTVLLTTQYLEEADRLADDIVVIDDGRVIAQGTATELKAELGATIVEIGLPTRASNRNGSAASCRSSAPPTCEGSTVEVKVDGGGRDVLEVVRLLDVRVSTPTPSTSANPPSTTCS